MARKINLKARLVQGGQGDDILSGDVGRDHFIIRAGDGNDVVSNFEPGVDRVLFDIGGAYSDIMYLGMLYDGLTFDNFIGTASFSVSAVDLNNDGLIDTRIASGNDSITLLGIAPDSLSGASLMGG